MLTRSNTDHIRVPVFTLQPLIENAVIHGVGPLEEGGCISVRVEVANKRLSIRVSDTGRGIPPEQVRTLMDGSFDPGRHVSGLGVGNVRTRIAAYCHGSSFDIQSLPDIGTTVLIEIPLNEEELTHV